MLLYMDGFDHYNDVNLKGWTAHGGNGLNSFTTGRTGTAVLGSNSSFGSYCRPLPAASGGFVVGVAIFMPSLANADWLGINEGAATDHLVLGITAAGLLTLKRGATLIATGTTALVANSWYYIEFKGVIHDTTGSYEVKIDGTTEAALTNVGPVDTRNAGTTGQWDRIWLHAWNNTAWDDLYICDQSGAIRNDFLGAVKIQTLMAQPGNGSNVGLTPSVSTDHGALVDENPQNTTDFNSSATVGVKDTYNLANMTLTGPVLGVQVNLFAAKSDAGLRRVAAVVRTGGADYDGAEQPILTSYRFYVDTRAQKPTPTTPVDWVTADIDALEAGMKITA